MSDGERPDGGPVDAVERVRARRRLVAVLALPLVLMAVAGTLTLLQLSGSSIALTSRGGSQDPDIVAGEPRAIRSDEFGLATPVQVGSAVKGTPVHTWIGLTDTDQRVTSLGISTSSWVTVFQPQSWPMLLLPVTTGFVMRWWFVIGIGVLGVYALLMALRARLSTAIPLALAVGFSPLAAWWSAPPPGPIFGFLAGAGAALVFANRATSRRWTIGLGLLAGYLACAAFLVLYPPWFITCGFVVAAAVIGHALQHRVGLVTFATSAVGAGVVFIGVIGLWAIQSSTALSAITSTYYPGHRISGAGEGNGAILFSAPLNAVMAANPKALVPTEYQGRMMANNQSEAASSWFPLPVLLALLAVVVLAYVLRRRAAGGASSIVLVDDSAPAGAMALLDTTQVSVDAGSEESEGDPAWRRWAGPLAVTIVLAVLMAWMFLPLPDIVGKLLQLTRVPGTRVTVSAGLAAAVLVHLCAGRVRLGRAALPWAVVGVGVLLSGPLVLWSADRLLASGTDGVARAVLIGIVVAACFAALLFVPNPWPFALVLGLVVFANYALVNPLYRGLGPLTDGPLAKTLRQTASAEGPTRWVSLAGGPVTAVILASPNEALSGMTYYPTEDVWAKLAPTQRANWNNYAKYAWEYDPTATPAKVVPDRGTNMKLRIDLCSPKVDFLDISYVVTKTGEVVPPCFKPVKDIVDLGNQKLTVSHRR